VFVFLAIALVLRILAFLSEDWREERRLRLELRRFEQEDPERRWFSMRSAAARLRRARARFRRR
jgi:hypothetical protein